MYHFSRKNGIFGEVIICQYGKFAVATLVIIKYHGISFSCSIEEAHPHGLVVSVSASHAVGRGFASRSDHTKDHHKNGTCVRVGV